MNLQPWNDPKHWRAQMRSWAQHWRFTENIRQARFPLVKSDHPLQCAIVCREQALELERISRRLSRPAGLTKNKTPGADQGTGHIQKRSNDKTT